MTRSYMGFLKKLSSVNRTSRGGHLFFEQLRRPVNVATNSTPTYSATILDQLRG
jgi:hypothetical protein